MAEPEIRRHERRMKKTADPKDQRLCLILKMNVAAGRVVHFILSTSVLGPAFDMLVRLGKVFQDRIDIQILFGLERSRLGAGICFQIGDSFNFGQGASDRGSATASCHVGQLQRNQLVFTFVYIVRSSVAFFGSRAFISRTGIGSAAGFRRGRIATIVSSTLFAAPGQHDRAAEKKAHQHKPGQVFHKSVSD